MAVIFAQETPEASGWLTTPFGPIIASIITGMFTVVTLVVAVRTARKTPHENLKALVEIRSEIQEDRQTLDPHSVLDKAIERELKAIEILADARNRGVLSYFKARVTSDHILGNSGILPGLAFCTVAGLVLVVLGFWEQGLLVTVTSLSLGLLLEGFERLRRHGTSPESTPTPTSLTVDSDGEQGQRPQSSERQD